MHHADADHGYRVRITVWNDINGCLLLRHEGNGNHVMERKGCVGRSLVTL